MKTGVPGRDYTYTNQLKLHKSPETTKKFVRASVSIQIYTLGRLRGCSCSSVPSGKASNASTSSNCLVPSSKLSICIIPSVLCRQNLASGGGYTVMNQASTLSDDQAHCKHHCVRQYGKVCGMPLASLHKTDAISGM
jgi:hypothetical protein